MERNGIILKDKELYTIGEVGRICGISAKALRYYDKIGIISPDKPIIPAMASNPIIPQ